MPRLTRFYIKSSLLFFIAALLAGLALAAQPALGLPAWLSALGPTYLHLFMVGWVTQLIFGVVFWMFPKYTLRRPRGSESLGWATFLLLNLGLVLRLVGEPLNSIDPGPSWGWLLAVSALLQWLAGLAFAANTWVRTKEK